MPRNRNTNSSSRPTTTRVVATRTAPKQERSKQTRERLLDVAGALLGEVGIERISTNMICARAKMTPPALYRYFKDKYAVLEALGQRLMDRQNAVLFVWVERHAPNGIRALRAHTRDLLIETAKVTASEPGALWTLRALRAVPQLVHVRIASHRFVTDRLVKAYAPLFPKVPRKELWKRIRISVEIGYALDEMLNEETKLRSADILDESTRILRNTL